MSQKVSELECFGGEGTTESGSEEGPLVPWGRIRGTMELTCRERSQERGDGKVALMGIIYLPALLTPSFALSELCVSPQKQIIATMTSFVFLQKVESITLLSLCYLDSLLCH